MLSQAEASSNMNETLVMSQGDQEESDDEVDDEVLSMEEPIPHSIFLTDMMPELEVVEPEKQAKPGLLESHFPISTEISREQKDKNNTHRKQTGKKKTRNRNKMKSREQMQTVETKVNVRSPNTNDT